MSIVRNRIEAFFEALEGGGPLHVEVKRQEILSALESMEQLVRDQGDLLGRHDEALEENALFRRHIAEDARNKLFLLGDADAARKAGELEYVPADRLLDEYGGITGRFDALCREPAAGENGSGSRGVNGVNNGKNRKDVTLYEV